MGDYSALKSDHYRLFRNILEGKAKVALQLGGDDRKAGVRLGRELKFDENGKLVRRG